MWRHGQEDSCWKTEITTHQDAKKAGQGQSTNKTGCVNWDQMTAGSCCHREHMKEKTQNVECLPEGSCTTKGN